MARIFLVNESPSSSAVLVAISTFTDLAKVNNKIGGVVNHLQHPHWWIMDKILASPKLAWRACLVATKHFHPRRPSSHLKALFGISKSVWENVAVSARFTP